MNVLIFITPRPFCIEYGMLAEVDIPTLKETKTVTVQGDFISKTRISTSLQIGNSRHGINFDIDGFKTDSVYEYSYLTNSGGDINYFKRLKRQGKVEYIEYVKEAVKIALIDYIGVELDEVIVKLILPEFE